MAAEAKPFERLSRDVNPKNYFISLKPDLQNWTFEGKEEVEIEIVKAVSTISINSAEIEVSSARCQDQTAEISYDKEEELVHFKFPNDLTVSTAKLSVEFTGILNDRMKGFYRSMYKTEDGQEKRVACTQFEPVDARRSFPCWDEPDRKATFDIELTVPKNLRALSNMPEISRQEEGELVRVRFDRTPIMSTYLLAYVVGEFDYVEDKDEDGVLIRVYTPVNKSEQGRFALEIAVKTLPFYHKYFDIAYPLPKMDLIAIPDFAAGAMENWGLVTYREIALLIDPKLSSTATRQRVALVVGHELAHQWFGNLVTMEWWTHLWLNEGFASFVEYLCVDHCLPSFNIWTQFLEQDLFRAFDLDSLKTSHPIEVECGHPNEIDEIFDAISYCKGASVIRMLHGYLGSEAFKKGLQIYLKRHQFGNTKTEDLWTALEEASNEPVNRIMSSWTLQMGYPVVTVKEVADGKLTVEQTRFLADGSTDDKAQWIVPITVTTSDRPNDVLMRFLLDSPSKTVDISSIGSDAAIKLNVNTMGVYRVCYPTAILAKLMDNVDKFAALDRLGLVNDMFALARSGHMSTADVLRQTLRLKGDTDFTVWCCLSSCLGEINLLVQSRENGDKLFDLFVQDMMEDIYRKLGWGPAAGDVENEDTNNQLLRPVVIGRLGLSGYAEVKDAAKEHFRKYQSKESEIPADLRSAVYATVLKHGEESDFNAMIEMHNSTDLSEEKMRIARSLGRAPIEFVERVHTFALSDQVRIQDTVFVLGSCTGSAAGRERTWQFLKDNWSSMLTKFSGLFLLGRLVKSVCSNFVTEDHANDVENFFKENKAPSAERAIEQSVENVRVNAAQLARDGDAIMRFLKEKYES